MNSATWNMMRRISETLIERNGVIFGGFVRDSILRRHHYAKFMQAVPYQKLSKFEDAEFMPEYSGRLALPKDLNCFINPLEISPFITFMTSIGFTVFDAEPEHDKEYDVAEDVGLMRIGISTETDTPGEIMTVIVELMYPFDDHVVSPPFAKLDFYCNALMLDKHNPVTPVLMPAFSGSSASSELVEIITLMIKKRFASAIGDSVPLRRTMTMMATGWTMSANGRCITDPMAMYTGQGGNADVVEVLDAEDDMCLICMDDIGSYAHKFGCCNALYHKSCMSKVVTTCATCPHCRATI